jgi:hypothetical protein
VSKAVLSCAAIASVLVLLACQAPERPLIAVPDPPVTEDDRGVMRAVLDALIRPNRDDSIRRGYRNPATAPARISAAILVFDSTIPLCEIDPAVEPPGARGCLGKQLVEHLRRLPAVSGPLSEASFVSRNARSMVIGGTLGDDVVFVPSGAVRTFQHLQEFRRRYPLGSAVVVFSAPAYRGESAVIFYHYLDSEGGFVHLVRRETRWSIERRSGWIE